MKVTFFSTKSSALFFHKASVLCSIPTCFPCRQWPRNGRAPLQAPAGRFSQQGSIASIYVRVCIPKSSEMLGSKKERKLSHRGDPNVSDYFLLKKKKDANSSFHFSVVLFFLGISKCASEDLGLCIIKFSPANTRSTHKAL